MITSFRHDRDKKQKRRAAMIGVFVVLLALMLNWGTSSKYVGGALAWMMTPVYSSVSIISETAHSLSLYFASKRSLERENELLRLRLEQYQLRTYEYDFLKSENTSLRNAFDRLPYDSEYILAQVLARPRVTPYDTILIDLGMYDGVGEGMQVFYEGGFAIGEIDTAYRHSALVRLYSSDGVQMEGFVGSSTIPVTIHGVGGGNFRILLPKGNNVKSGDVVRIPALNPTFLGTIEHVDVSENSSIAVLYMKFPFDYQRVDKVYVALPTVSR